MIDSLEQAEIFLSSHYDEAVQIHSALNNFSEELVEKSMSLHNHELQNPLNIYDTMNTLAEVLLDLGKIEQIPHWDKILDPALFINRSIDDQ